MNVTKDKYCTNLGGSAVNGGDDPIERPLQVGGRAVGDVPLELDDVHRQRRHVAPQQPPPGPPGTRLTGSPAHRPPVGRRRDRVADGWPTPRIRSDQRINGRPDI